MKKDNGNYVDTIMGFIGILVCLSLLWILFSVGYGIVESSFYPRPWYSIPKWMIKTNAIAGVGFISGVVVMFIAGTVQEYKKLEK